MNTKFFLLGPCVLSLLTIGGKQSTLINDNPRHGYLKHANSYRENGVDE